MSVADRILKQCLGIPGFLQLWRRLELGSVPTRTRHGAWPRPHYAYGVFAAAELAKRLGLSSISVIELGVAGGSGLIALEKMAKAVGDHFAIDVRVYGFDAGSGMPAPIDYRDLAHVWGEGFYKMDEAKLRAQLSRAELFIGDVTKTIPQFVAGGHPPIGFVAFDLDYYSSTKAAFKLFDGETRTRLPRVYCYMDDIIWPEYACHNEYVGELLAIKEFNSEHPTLKLTPLHLLRHMRSQYRAWNDQIYVLHDFAHPLYTKNVTYQGEEFREMRLR